METESALRSTKGRQEAAAAVVDPATGPSRERTPLHPDLIDFDPLSRDLWVDVPSASRATAEKSLDRGMASPSHAIHIKLPPRPSEIDNEEGQATRSTRRFSDLLRFAGPNSPPSVTSAGNDIVFHPSSPTSETALGDLNRVHSRDPAPRRRSSHNIPRDQSSKSSPSKLLNNLVSTSKVAAKWRNSTDAVRPSGGIAGLPDHPENDFGENLVFDEPSVNHSSPFASAQRIAGSYIPPSGAPGFDSRAAIAKHDNVVQDDLAGKIRLKDRRPTTTPLLDDSLASALRTCLPPRQKLSSEWTLIFSLDQHGASLATLYRLAEKYGANNRNAGSVLVVLDDAGNRFGAYLNGPLEKREGSYYGGGEAFLYKIDQEGSVTPFHWTGQNQYYALCESSFISFGGGAGTYGLILDATFTRNSSATCPTFENDILCATIPQRQTKAVPFVCLGLELWST